MHGMTQPKHLANMGLGIIGLALTATILTNNRSGAIIEAMGKAHQGMFKAAIGLPVAADPLFPVPTPACVFHEDAMRAVERFWEGF